MNWLVWPEAIAQFGIKAIKYFIDSQLREQVTPVPGSVIYSDLFFAVEHSAIYEGEGDIVNLLVEQFAQARVTRCGPARFTDGSKLGKKIYVSCKDKGAVGDATVAAGAVSHVGERDIYLLVVKNCHQFSSKCLNYAAKPAIPSLFNWFVSMPETFEPTLKHLKIQSQKRLGATKWRLWDWQNQRETIPPPNWQECMEFYESQALTPEFVESLGQEQQILAAYQAEISDENLAKEATEGLAQLKKTLAKVVEAANDNKGLLKALPNLKFSYKDLTQTGLQQLAIGQALTLNPGLRRLIQQLGRQYVRPEKKQRRVPTASLSEFHGTHLSDDLLRLLPTELLNLEDNELSWLFYARLAEKTLFTYQLRGNETETETYEEDQQGVETGPIVACIDTSGSMSGKPIELATALLLAIANLLEREKRSLHIILFGGVGQTKELSLVDGKKTSQMLRFISQGFGGGTDFDTPVRKAIDNIAGHKAFFKADILMITDGQCSLSIDCLRLVEQQRIKYGFELYAVVCDNSSAKVPFCDEIVYL